MLVSRQNSRIKYVRRLYQKKFRDSEGKFIIEGVRFIEEAINANWTLETVFYESPVAGGDRGQQLLENLSKSGAEIIAVEKSLFREIADTESPQGILAVAKKPTELDFKPVEWRKNEKDLLVMVDGVQDPGNLGTIIRSADAAGADCVFILKGTVDPYNPKTLRSTMGSIFHIPLVSVEDREDFLTSLHAGGWNLVVGDPVASKLLCNADLTRNTVLVIGNEASGVSEDLQRDASDLVKIPMPGRAESLNAGVAAGIMLYETVRQRMAAGRIIARP
ncbi:TrmH family RNA methyltransferase [Desulfotruncus alcoholivorax]|uniref:TrmH family RNA methyltransferase n=1 Tax=Desulfotruncus alcoholivorax TaxID=265477 RepID=UPI00041243B9|nr:RNA methyltransferase [Desulfotruncus alcoholivorax]